MLLLLFYIPFVLFHFVFEFKVKLKFFSDLFSFFFPGLLTNNWHISLYKFKVCNMVSSVIYIYYEMITTTGLVNIYHLIYTQ